MANELINPVAVGKDSLIRLENVTVTMKMVSREFDDKYAVQDEKIGYIFNARLPVRVRGRRGDGMKPEPVREQVVPIVIDTLWGADLEFSDQDLTMTVDRFTERYVQPGVDKIGNDIDGDLLDLYKNVYSHVGTPGTTPTTVAPYAQAGAELANNACPQNDKTQAIILNPDMEVNALGFGANIFTPAKEIGDQYLTGKMGRAVGARWNMDQNVAGHLVGIVGTSTPLVNGANQTGNAIITDGWNATVQVLNRGDIVTFAGTNGVNPISFRPIAKLRTFVVTADVISDGGGNATIPIAPDMNVDATSVFQTATASPADNAVIKVFGVAAANFANLTAVTTPQALRFHKDAFTVAIVKQELPGGMEWSEWAASPKAGLGVRLVRGYSIQDNKKYTRLDVLGGVKCVRPELACRISG